MAKDDAERLEVSVNIHSCGTLESYNFHYDAKFCPKCDVWTEKKCGYEYPECRTMCSTRPDKPSGTDK